MNDVRDPSPASDLLARNGGPNNPVAEAIRTRRTIHNFRPETPPRERIVQAIDLARWAPNHRLTEPWRFRLLGQETAEAVARLNAERTASERGEKAGQVKLERWRAVPGWLVVTCVHSENPIRSREDYAACCCAVQNLMLYLWSEGVGTKWTTGDVTRDPRFFELLGIDPDEERLVSMLWYGYPDEVPQTQRRPVGEILQELP